MISDEELRLNIDRLLKKVDEYFKVNGKIILPKSPTLSQEEKKRKWELWNPKGRRPYYGEFYYFRSLPWSWQRRYRDIVFWIDWNVGRFLLPCHQSKCRARPDYVTLSEWWKYKHKNKIVNWVGRNLCWIRLRMPSLQKR